MNRKKVLYWLPLPLILAGIAYMLIFRRVDLFVIVLLIGALILGGIAVQVEK